MLRFTRRQYQSILRRGGVKEPGLSFQDTPILAALIDDFRALIPEQPNPHAYVWQYSAAVVNEYTTFELTAPEGGMYIEECGQFGAADRWAWMRTIATLISTGQAAATRIDIQEPPTQATFESGTALVYVGNTTGIEYANTVEHVVFQRPLYIPSGRKFVLCQGTKNDSMSWMLRWREPGV